MSTPFLSVDVAAHAAAMDSLEAVLAVDGIPTDWVTSAGTGTFAVALERSDLITELQPGSCALMDPTRACDEHGRITGALEGVRVGDTLELIPAHGDTTIPLHDLPQAVGDTPGAE